MNIGIVIGIKRHGTRYYVVCTSLEAWGDHYQVSSQCLVMTSGHSLTQDTCGHVWTRVYQHPVLLCCDSYYETPCTAVLWQLLWDTLYCCAVIVIMRHLLVMWWLSWDYLYCDSYYETPCSAVMIIMLHPVMWQLVWDTLYCEVMLL